MTDVVKSEQNLTTKRTFIPSAKQDLWLDTAIRIGTLSPTDIEADSKISRVSWYTWIKNEEFVDWFLDQWNRRLRSHGPALDVIGLKNAKRDFKYWEAMQKRVGNLQDKPQVLVQQNNQLNDIEFITDENQTTQDAI